MSDASLPDDYFDPPDTTRCSRCGEKLNKEERECDRGECFDCFSDAND